MSKLDMTDNDIIHGILNLLSNKEWTPSTIQDVATLLDDNGYHIEDYRVDEASDENVYQGADGYEAYIGETPLDTPSLDDHPMSIAHRMEHE